MLVLVFQLPDDKDDPLKPVMVFIHGGAFYFGSSSSKVYGADYLVDEGVVLVTINYRLGIQGYLPYIHLTQRCQSSPGFD
jgi:carboxylesterase type B